MIKKKILMIAPTPFYSNRGCHMRIFEEARWLSKDHYLVKIVTYQVGDNPEGFDVERIPDWFFWSRVGLKANQPTWHKIYLDFFLLLKTFVVAIKFRPAVLHCHLHEGALIGLLVGPLLGAKVIFDSQGGLTDELSRFKMIEKGSLLYGIFLLIEKAIYRLVPTIVASNESNYAMLRDLFKVPETKLRLVPDAISFDIKTDPKVTETLRKEMKIPSDRKVIVYLGSYTEVQNVEAVLKLAEVMKSKRQDIFWVLRGNGDVAHYQNLVQTLKLSDRVYLGDVIPYLDSQSYLALGDFAITLKLRTTESNGKLLSYALARLPIIALDHQSNRSLIGDSACYLGGDGDYEAWSSKLSKYLDLPKSTHEETARQLEKKIKACYAWESIIKKLESIYDGDNI